VYSLIKMIDYITQAVLYLYSHLSVYYNVRDVYYMIG